MAVLRFPYRRYPSIWILRFFLTMWVICLLSITSFSQGFDGLTQLKGQKTGIYYSTGSEKKAKRISHQLDRVLGFYQQQIRFTPSVTLLVLSPADWNQYSRSVVYGMPHYTNEKTLIVASENNEFWKSFIPPVDKMPKDIAKQITQTYSDEDGGLTMEPFFDLLAIHELGHAYHIQDSLKMQRNWMGELFVNIFLHTYIAENEPNLLPALTIFPKMVASSTEARTLAYTTLDELEKNYNEIAQKHPRNYGWYQSKWHMAAGKVYDNGGINAFKKLWYTLKQHRTSLDDAAFAELLSEKVHQSVADVLLKWDKGLSVN